MIFEFLNILIDGTFALIPWAISFLFELSLGDLLINSSQTQFVKYLYMFLPIGVTFLIVGILNVPITGIIDNKKIELYMASFGAFLILLLACHYYIDIKKV